jgi:hypothetical protein
MKCDGKIFPSQAQESKAHTPQRWRAKSSFLPSAFASYHIFIYESINTTSTHPKRPFKMSELSLLQSIADRLLAIEQHLGISANKTGGKRLLFVFYKAN